MKEIAAVIITDTHLKEDNILINKSVYRQAIKFCKENGIDTIFHLSDIFNSRKSQSQEVLVDGFVEILDELQQEGITLITFPGNHDKTSYDSIKSFLDPYKHHPAFVLIDTYYKLQLTPNITLHLLPFFSDSVYREMLNLVEITEEKRMDSFDILFTHIGVNGARMNNGQVVEGISQDDFRLFDKVFIGHYHDKQIFGKFNYVGATIQHNYGETPDKGLTVIYNDLSWETVELDFPRYHKIEVDVDKLTNSEIEEIKRVKEKSGDNLRVILVGSEAKVKSFNKQLLLNEGISVENKVDEIVKEELVERVNPFTSATLLTAFESFCKKDKLEEEKGKKYLQKVI